MGRLDYRLVEQVLETLKGEKAQNRASFIHERLPFGQGRIALFYVRYEMLQDTCRQAMAADTELGNLECSDIKHLDGAMTEFTVPRKKLLHDDT